MTLPLSGLIRARISLTSVLFPAPVSPVTAVMLPGLKSWLNLEMISFPVSPSLYENETLSNLIPAVFPNLTAGTESSAGSSSSSDSRSADTAAFIADGSILLMSTTGL